MCIYFDLFIRLCVYIHDSIIALGIRKLQAPSKLLRALVVARGTLTVYAVNITAPGAGQEALATCTRTDTRTPTSNTQRTHARTHICAPGTRPSSQPGLNLRREGLGGCANLRQRHVRIRPEGTGCDATGRENFPLNILPSPINTIIHVCAPAPPSKSRPPKIALLSRRVTGAGLSHEATTVLSHEVTDASPKK